MIGAKTKVTGMAENAGKAEKGALQGAFSAISAFSAIAVEFRRPVGAGTASAQPSLPAFGPDASDPFRFTWYTTPAGAEVWIERRGRWVKGRIVGRGRKYVEVGIAGAGGRRCCVRTLYSELRRR